MPISAYERVKIARGGKRPTGADFIDHLFTGFFELHGDRRFADDAAIIGGVAYLDTLPVTVIAIEKGRDTNIEVTPDYRLKADDIIVVIGKVNNIDAFENHFE